MMFVSMPWASPRNPMLGIGVLSGKLKSLGFETKTFNFNVHFASLIGEKNYGYFSEYSDSNAVGEYLFASHYFNYSEEYDLTAFKTFFGEEFLSKNPTYLASLINLKSNIIPIFIEDCLEKILDTNFKVIGFTSTFNQIFASLLLAKKIKERSPDRILVLGGSSFHAEMGIEYSLRFKDVIDYVFTGESDNSLIKFFDYLNKIIPFEEIDGIAKHGVCSKDALPITNLKDVECPDYDDYFNELNLHFGKEAPTIFNGLPFESSRGCWWGQKSHCTFCGLNSMGMGYRFKSDETIINELKHLSGKYSVVNFVAADNILPAKAYDGLLLKLADLPYQYSFFYEIKSNVSRKAAFSLYLSNVKRIQPGIESFSSRVLSLMKKGVSSIQNVQLLKLAKEYGIDVSFNILCHFSGENQSDYDEMIGVIDKITHLQPPSGFATTVQVQRFSPMHSNPSEFDYVNVRPYYFYNLWFPKNFIDLDKVAYFFERDKGTHEVDISSLNIVLRKWMENETTFYAEMGFNFIQITEIVREEIVGKTILNELDSLLFVLTDENTHLNSISHFFNNALEIKEIENRLERLVQMNLLIKEGPKYLSIIPYLKPQQPDQINDWLKAALQSFVENKSNLAANSQFKLISA